MKLFLFEMKKIWSLKSMQIFMLVCIILNALIFYYQEKNESSYYSPEEYRVLVQEMEKLPTKDACMELRKRLEEIDNEEDAFEKKQLIQDVLLELENVSNRETYVQSIFDQADKMLGVSIFNNGDDYSYKNIRKTVQDFSKLRDLELEFGMTKGITSATNSEATDLIGVLLLVFIATVLVWFEKQQEYLLLVSPCSNGRVTTIIAKIIAVIVSSALAFIGLYFGNYIVARYLYGSTDMEQFVQSAWVYRNCILTITMKQYVVLFLVSKIAIYVVVGLIAMSFGLIFKRNMAYFAGICVLFGVSGVSYFGIPANSPFAFFKYVNLYSFLLTDDLLMQYQNVNLFGTPVNIITIFLGWALGNILCFSVILVCLFKGKYIGVEKTNIQRKLRRKTGRSIWHFEFLKNWVKNGAILVLGVFLLVQVALFQNVPQVTGVNDIYYRIYMQYMEGPVGGFTEEYVEQEDKRYNELMQSLMNADTIEESAEISEQLAAQEAWNQVKSEYGQLADRNGKTETNLWVIYPEGLELLMGSYKQLDYQTAVLLVLTVSVGLAGLFASDKELQIDSLIQTTVNGRRKTLMCRFASATGLSLLAWIIAYVGDYCKVSYYYGISGWQAPVQSLDRFADIDGNYTIGIYMLLLYLIKLLGVLVASMSVLVISFHSKSVVKTMMLSVLFLGIPSVLCMVGVETLEMISLQVLLSASWIADGLVRGQIVAIIPITLGMIWIFGCGYHITKNYTK